MTDPYGDIWQGWGLEPEEPDNDAAYESWLENGAGNWRVQLGAEQELAEHHAIYGSRYVQS